jgi:hypothetical protein
MIRTRFRVSQIYEKRSYMSSTRSTDDFQLKSSMFHQNDGLWISGRNIWAGVGSENKPHLLNKPNYVPWDPAKKIGKGPRDI